jgi:Protein kinase domain
MRVPRFCPAEVLAADPDATEPYLVTEFIDGPTLHEAVTTDGPLRGADLDQLAISMATALAGIHAAGIVHRDLKPANVLLSRMGPRVIDFGIAGAVGATRLTRDGRILGTPAYMAPEQLHARPCPASDVFAWGGVMVFAATGRRPFGGATGRAAALNILEREPDLTGLVGPLREVVAAALTKDPEARPTPARLLESLTRPAPGAGEPDRTQLDAGATLADAGELPEPWRTPVRPPEPTRVRARRRRAVTWLAPLTAVALLGTVVGVVLLRGRTPDFSVTDVGVRAEGRRHGCGARVVVTGTVTTNGAAGQIDYQWKRSDQRAPDPPLHQDVARGGKQATIRLLWDIEGRGTRRFTATLTVLNPPERRRSASFLYSCSR